MSMGMASRSTTPRPRAGTAAPPTSGYEWGENDLANFYLNGSGVRQDYGEALRLYLAAAAAGNATAQSGIGDLYANGLGVARDQARAFRWYRLAAAGGDAYRREPRRHSLRDRAGRGPRPGAGRALVPRRRRPGRRRRRRPAWATSISTGVASSATTARPGACSETAAAQGDPAARSGLGYMYAEGVTSSRTMPRRWICSARRRRTAMPGRWRGWAYFHEQGMEVTQSDAEALRWYRAAAEAGDDVRGVRARRHLSLRARRAARPDAGVALV